MYCYLFIAGNSRIIWFFISVISVVSNKRLPNYLPFFRFFSNSEMLVWIPRVLVLDPCFCYRVPRKWHPKIHEDQRCLVISKVFEVEVYDSCNMNRFSKFAWQRQIQNWLKNWISLISESAKVVLNQATVAAVFKVFMFLC